MRRNSEILTVAVPEDVTLALRSTADTARTAEALPGEIGATAGPRSTAGSGDGSALTLGRYRLGRRLGTGGFGTVYAAHDERLDRPVAIKILPRERVIESRFAREARAAARLSHPGIVTLFEAAIDDDGAYLVSELVRGGTLAQGLARGDLSDRDILGVGIALTDALEHAHAHGVVHRDVKPENVLVPSRRGTPAAGPVLAKLTDFGVARVVGGDTLTRTGDVIGTVAYMSPEQAEGRDTGPEADLYSLALVLYEALTGVNPVRDRLRSGASRRLGTYLPPVRRQRADLPRPLGAAIDRALRPRPCERGTLGDLRETLSDAITLASDRAGVVAPARAIALTRRLDRPAPPLAFTAPPAAPRPDLTAPAAPARSRQGGGFAPSGLLLLAFALLALGAGAVGLAGVWPGLVARSIRGPWRRALLGALGLLWIAAGDLLSPRNFGVGPITSSPRTLTALGVCALLWTVAAVIGPWLAGLRRPWRSVSALGVWTLALALGPRLAGLTHTTGLTVGALLGGLLLGALPLLAGLRYAIAARALA
ncbi:serine/threonine-protein kinase [Conexibacter sp. DBS9H8]|uniref:serine/threonine-protein kinase n=1 Tax=Conexibacter sp. DBS9H8 TaxID=2937801 RepID=UPI00200E0200|nr:serine/threonine-protein kinase [Conexibacter sp. DBS9H8]